VLVLWWGSIKRGEITAGDYMAAGNVALGLQARGLTVEIAAFNPFPVPGITVIHPRNAAPTRYRVAIFVCGPIRTNRSLVALMTRYRGLRRLAAGVMVVPEDPEILSYFDRVIARDGTDDAHFDLALADPWRTIAPRRPDAPRTAVATCYRGRQRDISARHCSLHAVAERLIEPVAQRLSGGSVLRIDTLTPSPHRVSAIAGEFARARLVFTTRLHGSLLSLEHMTPFVAVDQIAHGQKVTSVLRKLGWPFCFVANETDQVALEAAAREVTQASFQPEIEKFRRTALEMSNATLAAVCDAVVEVMT
jgi:hypothetical protein